ncbi:DLW-39 family protein [Ancrocorticia populi]|nr:DLW-39 family protein [Ancrocorticia populi]MDN6486137.1 DLW-39 family protein [Ancrocorticia sp.]
MKKFLIIALTAIAGYAGWLEYQRRTQDRAVWNEVTDPIA